MVRDPFKGMFLPLDERRLIFRRTAARIALVLATPHLTERRASNSANHARAQNILLNVFCDLRISG